MISCTVPIAVGVDTMSPTAGVLKILSTYKIASIFPAITLVPSNDAVPGPLTPNGKIPFG